MLKTVKDLQDREKPFLLTPDHIANVDAPLKPMLLTNPSIVPPPCQVATQIKTAPETDNMDREQNDEVFFLTFAVAAMRKQSQQDGSHQPNLQVVSN